jgi:hypothetical protein
MDNDHPKVDMVNILPVDTEKVAKEPVEEENEEAETIEEMIDDATMKAAAALASSELSPSVPLPRAFPGAYHVVPTPTAAAIATAATISARQGRASSFDRTLINTYTEDHLDDSATILVPTASVVHEKELYVGQIVEAAPWGDPFGPLEAMDASNKPKDAVWIGRKRASIYLFVIVVVITGLVTGLSMALIRSDRSEEQGPSVSLSSFDDSATGSPSPSPSRPLQEQLMSYTPSSSPSSSVDDYEVDEVDYQDDEYVDDDEEYEEYEDDSAGDGSSSGSSSVGDGDGYGRKRT